MKRRFFQIHLLTALVGMLTIAGFMWANMSVQRLEFLQIVQIYRKGTVTFQPHLYEWIGWPAIMADEQPPVLTTIKGGYNLPEWFTGYDTSRLDVMSATGIPSERLKKIQPTTTLFGNGVVTLPDLLRQDPSLILAVEKTPARPWQRRLSRWTMHFYPQGVVINIGVALAAISLVVVGTEKLLRRRERAKK